MQCIGRVEITKDGSALPLRPSLFRRSPPACLQPAAAPTEAGAAAAKAAVRVAAGGRCRLPRPARFVQFRRWPRCFSCLRMRLVALTFAERCCTLAAVVSRQRISMSTPPSSFIEEVNTKYEDLHRRFEEQARQYESPPIREHCCARPWPEPLRFRTFSESLCQAHDHLATRSFGAQRWHSKTARIPSTL